MLPFFSVINLFLLRNVQFFYGKLCHFLYNKFDTDIQIEIRKSDFKILYTSSIFKLIKCFEVTENKTNCQQQLKCHPIEREYAVASKFI